MDKLEAQRRMIVDALGSTYQLRHLIEDAAQAQRAMQEAIENPLEAQRRMVVEALGSTYQLRRLTEDDHHIHRFSEIALGRTNNFTLIADTVNQMQRAVQSALGESRAFTELFESVSRQQWILDQSLGSAFSEQLAASAAIRRSFALSSQIFTAMAAIVDRIEAERSLEGAVVVSEEGAEWLPWLEEFLDTFINAIETVEERIDHRALLRFFGRMLPLILTVYGIGYAHISSEQMNSRIDGLESSIEESRLETGKEYEKLRNAQEESMSRIKSRLDELSNRLDEHREHVEASAFYIVRRPVPLMEERRYQGRRFTWLMPGQEVEVVERSRKWLRVIGYDIKTGEIHIGWVLKKYLRLVVDAPKNR